MIPDHDIKVRITGTLKFLSHFAAEIEGFVYADEATGHPDVVTFDAGKAGEIEISGKYGTAPEDAIRDVLLAEADRHNTRSRLMEAYRKWKADKREAAQEYEYEDRLSGV